MVDNPADQPLRSGRDHMARALGLLDLFENYKCKASVHIRRKKETGSSNASCRADFTYINFQVQKNLLSLVQCCHGTWCTSITVMDMLHDPSLTLNHRLSSVSARI